MYKILSTSTTQTITESTTKTTTQTTTTTKITATKTTIITTNQKKDCHLVFQIFNSDLAKTHNNKENNMTTSYEDHAGLLLKGSDNDRGYV